MAKNLDNEYDQEAQKPLLSNVGYTKSSSTYRAINESDIETPTNNVSINSPLDSDDKPVVDGPFRIIFAAIFMCIFLSAFESTIVATIYTTIGSEFHQSNKVSWVATSYFLTSTTFQPMYGRLSDIFGRKNAFIAAISLFLIGTLGCTFAPNMDFLIAARAFAGIGGGGLTTVASIVMSDLVSLRERGKYQGFGNAIFASASLIGAPLGGALTDHFSWRFAFGIAVPMAILSLIVVAVSLTNYNLSPHRTRDFLRSRLSLIDYWGALTLVIAITAIVLGLSLGGNVYKWEDTRVVVSLIIGAIFFITFFWIEDKVAECPIMPTEVLVRRTPFGCYMTNFFASMTSIVGIFVIPLYFQATQNKTATEAGLYILPKVVSGSLGSIAGGYIISRTGKYRTFTRLMCALMVISSLGLMTLNPETTTQFECFSYIALDGFGFGAALTTTLVALLAGTKASEMAVANAMSYLFRSLGTVLGLAASSAVLQAVLKIALEATIHGPDAAWVIDTARKSVTEIYRLPPEYLPAIINAYVKATQWGFGFSSICALLALLSSFFIEDIQLSTSVKRT